MSRREREKGGRSAPWDRYFARNEWSRLTARQRRTILNARQRGDVDSPRILGLAIGTAPSSAPRREAKVLMPAEDRCVGRHHQQSRQRDGDPAPQWGAVRFHTEAMTETPGLVSGRQDGQTKPRDPDSVAP